MKQLLLLLSLLLSQLMTAQDGEPNTVRPDEFPTKTNPSSFDAIYSQEDNGDPVKILFADARKYFGTQVIPEAAPPQSINNPENLRNKLILVTSNNQVWFCDFNGIALKVYDPADAGGGGQVYTASSIADTSIVVDPKVGDILYVDNESFAFRNEFSWLVANLSYSFSISDGVNVKDVQNQDDLVVKGSGPNVVALEEDTLEVGFEIDSIRDDIAQVVVRNNTSLPNKFIELQATGSAIRNECFDYQAGYLYVKPNGSDSLQVFSVSGLNYTKIKSVKVNGTGDAIVLADGNYLAVANEIYNISNPVNPILETPAIAELLFFTAKRNGEFYGDNGVGNVLRYNPVTRVLDTIFQHSTNILQTGSISFYNDFLLLSTPDAIDTMGVLLDLKKDASQSPIWFEDYPGANGSFGSTSNFLAGQRAFFCSSDSIAIFDISRLDTAIYLGSIPATTSFSGPGINAISVNGDYLIEASKNFGVFIRNINNLDSVVVVDSLLLPESNFRSLRITSDYLITGSRNSPKLFLLPLNENYFSYISASSISTNKIFASNVVVRDLQIPEGTIDISKIKNLSQDDISSNGFEVISASLSDTLRSNELNIIDCVSSFTYTLNPEFLRNGSKVKLKILVSSGQTLTIQSELGQFITNSTISVPSLTYTSSQDIELVWSGKHFYVFE